MAIEVQKVFVDTPHRKQILHAVKILERGGVIVYPTDTIYGLGADILSKEAVAKIFKIKQVSTNKLLSFIFADLSDIAKWAHIPNNVYRIMRRVLPGKYTFILPASKEVPKGILQKRKTIGVRVPDSEVARALISELGRPLLSASVPTETDDFSTDPEEIAERYRYDIDLLLDAGIMPALPSTVVDFSIDPPEIIREGAGDINVLF
ncbi:MAG: L-threonylcarbamoyladenylate synthase [Acidobacteria bacterium]|jgi:tRNA threonylcarbamoyl adenosine modification protein (Sua5/YciO/YrdC/YwlC family)|nr:L-threonylcarbamoyladenylate synthase [Acidobacteriota bacterium]